MKRLESPPLFREIEDFVEPDVWQEVSIFRTAPVTGQQKSRSSQQTQQSQVSSPVEQFESNNPNQVLQGKVFYLPGEIPVASIGEDYYIHLKEIRQTKRFMIRQPKKIEYLPNLSARLPRPEIRLIMAPSNLKLKSEVRSSRTPSAPSEGPAKSQPITPSCSTAKPPESRIRPPSTPPCTTSPSSVSKFIRPFTPPGSKLSRLPIPTGSASYRSTFHRPFISPGSMSYRQFTSPGSMSYRPFNSPGSMPYRPSTSSGFPSHRPSTPSGFAYDRPSTSSGFPSQRPSTSSGFAYDPPSTSSGFAYDRPSTSSASTFNRPSTSPESALQRPSTSSGSKLLNMPRFTPSQPIPIPGAMATPEKVPIIPKWDSSSKSPLTPAATGYPKTPVFVPIEFSMGAEKPLFIPYGATSGYLSPPRPSDSPPRFVPSTESSPIFIPSGPPVFTPSKPSLSGSSSKQSSQPTTSSSERKEESSKQKSLKIFLPKLPPPSEEKSSKTSSSFCKKSELLSKSSSSTTKQSSKAVSSSKKKDESLSNSPLSSNKKSSKISSSSEKKAESLTAASSSSTSKLPKLLLSPYKKIKTSPKSESSKKKSSIPKSTSKPEQSSSKKSLKPEISYMCFACVKKVRQPPNISKYNSDILNSDIKNTCFSCEESFVNRSALRQHQDRTNFCNNYNGIIKQTLKTFECLYCRKHYPTFEQLIAHLNTALHKKKIREFIVECSVPGAVVYTARGYNRPEADRIWNTICSIALKEQGSKTIIMTVPGHYSNLIKISKVNGFCNAKKNDEDLFLEDENESDEDEKEIVDDDDEDQDSEDSNDQNEEGDESDEDKKEEKFLQKSLLRFRKHRSTSKLSEQTLMNPQDKRSNLKNQFRCHDCRRFFSIDQVMKRFFITNL